MQPEQTVYFAQGKLLITAEYTVLHGALALAVPTVKGQYLAFTPGPEPLYWEAEDVHGMTWLKGYVMREPSLAFVHSCIQGAMELKGQFGKLRGRVKTRLEFERSWGWGTSSTCISLIAQWLEVDAMALHAKVSKGSGYDVACATATGPMLFRKDENGCYIKPVSLNHWPTEHLFFGYSGQKQYSQTAVEGYLQETLALGVIAESTDWTQKILEANEAGPLRDLIIGHEAFMGRHLGMKSPLSGQTAPSCGKSLGAWGVDFGLFCIQEAKDLAYLQQDGYGPIFAWKEVVRHG